MRMHIWSLHHDARHFVDPERFWPERWLIAEGAAPPPPPLTTTGAEFVHNPNAFIPFSFGPYNCVGKNLAMMEMRIVLCHVVQRLELTAFEGWDPREWEGRFKDKFVAEVWKLPVVIKVRG